MLERNVDAQGRIPLGAPIESADVYERQRAPRIGDGLMGTGRVGVDMAGFTLRGGIISGEVRFCPQCRERMDMGTLGFFTLLGGARWYKERSSLMLGGDSIVKNPLGGDTWLDGFRCSKCRMVMLYY